MVLGGQNGLVGLKGILTPQARRLKWARPLAGYAPLCDAPGTYVLQQ